MDREDKHHQVSGLTHMQQKQRWSKAENTVTKLRKRIWVEASL